MSRSGAALAVVLAATGCASPGPIEVSGTVFDFEAALGLVRQGKTARQAHDATLMAGVFLHMAEDSGFRSNSTGSDGRYSVPGAPARLELHPIVTRIEGFVTTEDGLGVQFAESDVRDYPVGILPRGPLVAAVAAGFGTTVDQLERVGFQLHAIFDRPFPDGALLTADIQVSPSAGRTIFVGWDGASGAYITAPTANQMPAGSEWLGVFAVTGTDVPVQVILVDRLVGPGHPKVYVQHPMAIVADRAMLFLLNPVN